ncbi:MAG: hypothetical protein ABI868_10845 [Acidobacteriota bacterium]
MNRAVALLAAAICLAAGRPAGAQDAPGPIGLFVVDLHGVVPRFGGDAALAESRGLTEAELPGSGLGVTAGGSLYFARLRAVTFGVGAGVMLGRTPIFSGQSDPALGLRAVTETIRSLSSELSLNFGNASGWSYLSGGVGVSRWAVVPDGVAKLPIDDQSRKTINYGGGARWFARKRLAFSLDVRFYEVAAGAPQLTLPASPRSKLLVIGAGISVR